MSAVVQIIFVTVAVWLDEIYGAHHSTGQFRSAVFPEMPRVFCHPGPHDRFYRVQESRSVQTPEFSRRPVCQQREAQRRQSQWSQAIVQAMQPYRENYLAVWHNFEHRVEHDVSTQPEGRCQVSGFLSSFQETPIM